MKIFIEISFFIIFITLLIAGQPSYSAERGDILTAPGFLVPGDTLRSKNGNWKFTLQTDGNLVFYNARNEAIWSSGTQGQEIWRATLERDGSFFMQKMVRYQDSIGYPITWQSSNYTVPGDKLSASLAVQDDGNVVINLQTSQGSSIVWQLRGWMKP